MVHLLTYFGLVNCLALAAALGLGYLGEAYFKAHFAFGFLGALSSVLWTGVAMFYLIYSGQAVKRAEEVGLAAKDDTQYCYSAKMKLFPWYVTSILLLITTPSLGAAAQTGAAPFWGHHMAAWLAASSFWATLYMSWARIVAHGAMLERIIVKVDAAKKARASSTQKEEGS